MARARFLPRARARVAGLLLLFVLLAAYSTPVVANEQGDPAFRGLRSVQFVLGGNLETLAPSLPADLQARVEKLLRTGGIPVQAMPDSAASGDDDAAWNQTALLLNVTAAEVCEGSYCINLRLSNSQRLGRYMGRGEWRHAFAEVWSSGRMIVVDRPQARTAIDEHATALVDLFVTEWLAANPAVAANKPRSAGR